MDRDQLVTLWEERQNRLGELLDGWGARDCDFRADLTRNTFLWVKNDGSPVVAAECRLLVSFELAKGSILASWANPRVPRGAAVSPQETVPPRFEDATEEQAWIAAMVVGLGARADYLYRAPSPELMTFLGLWNVRLATPADAPEPVGIRELVLEVLEALDSLLADLRRDRGATRRLFVNQGRALQERAAGPDSATPESELEAETGRVLERIGNEIPPTGMPPAAVAKGWRSELRRLGRVWKQLEG